MKTDLVALEKGKAYKKLTKPCKTLHNLAKSCKTLWWYKTAIKTSSGRYSHQSRCSLNPKRVQANDQPIQQSIQQPILQSIQQPILQPNQLPTELDPFDEYVSQMQNQGDNAEENKEAPDSDSDYVDDTPEPQQAEQTQKAVQPLQAERRLNLHAINLKPVVTPKTKIKQVKSKIETLCGDVVKLANSMRSNTANDNTFNDIMQSVLTEKVVSAKLDRSTANHMVDFLATAADMHSLNFQFAKNRLLKEYVDHPFSDAQRRVIDDLAVLEVNNDSVEEQLMYSLYFEKRLRL